MTDNMEQARAFLYRLLAAVLSYPPTEPVLAGIRALPPGDGTPIADAIGAVAAAARAVTLDAARREYDALFVGMSRGEVVPYGSFYQTGFLHDRPLARLREDLAALGLAPVAGHPDPEDHAGTLCELMAGMIDGGHGVPQRLDAQRRFFIRHLAPWLERFFADLATAPSARLYAAVGHLGRAFCTVEHQAFEMEA